LRNSAFVNHMQVKVPLVLEGARWQVVRNLFDPLKNRKNTQFMIHGVKHYRR